MRGIIIFDINEINGNTLTEQAKEQLEEKLEELAEDLYHIFSFENEYFDYEKAEELQDNYKIPEDFEVKIGNGEFFFAKNGYSLSINR